MGHRVVVYVPGDKNDPPVTVYRLILPDATDAEQADRDSEEIGFHLANGHFTIDIEDANG
jgi:hypothetical protein